MKLLLIHQAFQTESGAGGTRHFEFGKQFVKAGNEFVVVASNLSYMDAKRIRDEERSKIIDGVEVVRARTPHFIHKGYFWRSVAHFMYMIGTFGIAILERNVDLIMGTSPSLFQATSAAFVALLRRKPFLLEIRDLWPDFAIDMGILNSRFLIIMARRVESFIYWRADHILVNSPAYVEYMLNRGINREKVSLIPNGVDPAMFDAQGEGTCIRKEFGLEDCFVVTYAGAIGRANDIPTIVRAAERLTFSDPKIRFLIVGGGKVQDEIRQLIAVKNLSNVLMAGTRPKSEMSQILAASDVCVATLLNIPMFKTVYPNKIFDYMAAGKPIALGIDGVIREVVEKSECGLFFKPGDDQQLAETIMWMKKEFDEAKKMGIRGRHYVAKHFNRHVHSAEFLTLAQSLVKE